MKNKLHDLSNFYKLRNNHIILYLFKSFIFKLDNIDEVCNYFLKNKIYNNHYCFKDKNILCYHCSNMKILSELLYFEYDDEFFRIKSTKIKYLFIKNKKNEIIDNYNIIGDEFTISILFETIMNLIIYNLYNFYYFYYAYSCNFKGYKLYKIPIFINLKVMNYYIKLDNKIIRELFYSLRKLFVKLNEIKFIHGKPYCSNICVYYYKNKYIFSLKNFKHSSINLPNKVISSKNITLKIFDHTNNFYENEDQYFIIKYWFKLYENLNIDYLIILEFYLFMISSLKLLNYSELIKCKDIFSILFYENEVNDVMQLLYNKNSKYEVLSNKKIKKNIFTIL